ncbi:hypothetical protein Q9Q94_12875 [Uliginosibacterium sp. 31-16]|uniref:N-acyl amino acid synthase FeeM domain-containing protein n=1 Tax=Uliginosibacterium sp. 31-16 TaxID=3068315 RepID=UPI00273DD90B|nr:hypothetical protein [Uliginosibacterium sp. 31-16]MDP5240429.1 hypothetical protein [Uliginosibacterium sp. 31-16]
MATDRPASTAAKLPHSRLCNSLQARPATEQPYVFEALRELAFETCLEVAGSTLRIGLAASAWQLEQARMLLETFHPAPRKSTPADTPAIPANERAVAVALHVSPVHSSQRAQGVITLRRDSEAGLTLDRRHREALDGMRAQGARLVEVEQLAFDRQAPRNAMIAPMIRALAGTVETWGATDIIAECTPLDAGFYCSKLGFKRLHKTGDTGKVLLYLPAQRIARLQARIASR